MLLEMRQIAGLALTDERHGNSILKKRQHVFTRVKTAKIVEKKAVKALEVVSDCVFCYVESQRDS